MTAPSSFPFDWLNPKPPDQFRDATDMILVTVRISDPEARRKAAARLVETGVLKLRVSRSDIEDGRDIKSAQRCK